MKKTEQEVREFWVDDNCRGDECSYKSECHVYSTATRGCTRFIEKSYAEQLAKELEQCNKDKYHLQKQLVGDECKTCLGEIDEGFNCKQCGENFKPLDAPSYEWMRDAYRHWFDAYILKCKELEQVKGELEYKNRLYADEVSGLCDDKRFKENQSLKQSLKDAVEAMSKVTVYSTDYDFDEIIQSIKSKHPDIWGEE